MKNLEIITDLELNEKDGRLGYINYSGRNLCVDVESYNLITVTDEDGTIIYSDIDDINDIDRDEDSFLKTILSNYHDRVGYQV